MPAQPHNEKRWAVKAYRADGTVKLYPHGQLKRFARVTAQEILEDNSEFIATVVVDGYEELPSDRQYTRDNSPRSGKGWTIITADGVILFADIFTELEAREYCSENPETPAGNLQFAMPIDRANEIAAMVKRERAKLEYQLERKVRASVAIHIARTLDPFRVKHEHSGSEEGYLWNVTDTRADDSALSDHSGWLDRESAMFDASMLKLADLERGN